MVNWLDYIQKNKMEPITINGIEILSNGDKKLANKLLNEYFPRIQRLVKNEISLRFFVKEHEKEGKKLKYTLHLELIAPTRTFKLKSSDWDFARALHKLLNKTMNKVESRLKSSEQH